MQEAQKVLSKSVEYVDGKVLRHVDDINSHIYIINTLKNLGMLGCDVVKTEVYDMPHNLLLHETLFGVIYSGEFTSSMAFDVTEKGINLALKLIDEGIYAWDALPHNFTYYHGNWLLYDFDALDIKSDNAKTFVRCIFKISFAAFELFLSGISRTELKHYFLNRISVIDTAFLLPFHRRWIFLFRYRMCMFLTELGFYKHVYKKLKKYCRNYKKHFSRISEGGNEYSINKSYTDTEFSLINEMTQKNKRVFGFGKHYADWTLLNTNKNISKFVYLDDYGLCDKFYNFIFRKPEYFNIQAAVLYPLVYDEIIPEEMPYRALYDNYNKLRFRSDCVIADFKDILKSTYNNDFCLRNIFDFVEQNGKMIIVFSNILYKKYFDKLKSVFNEYFEKTESFETEYKTIVLLTSKYNSFEPDENIVYENKNRMYNAKLHSIMIKRIVTNH